MKVISFKQPTSFYNSEEFINKLNISPSSLRTYTSHFRRQGRTYAKKNNRVMYTEEDLVMFQNMLELHQKGFGTIAECVSNVCEQSHVVSPLPIKQEKTNTVTLEVFQSTVNSLEEQIKQLHQYVDGRLEQRDKVLLETVREIQALKQMKQKRWWHFWR